MKVGLHIGCSSVKVAYGTDGVPEILRLPVGAGLVETCSTTLDAKPDVGAGRIVPQPVGAYGSYSLDSARGMALHKLDMGMSILIVDSGHYSLDWVLYRLGWQLDSSGSTTCAGDVVIERATARLARDLKHTVSKNSILNGVMRVSRPLTIGGTEVDFWPAINDEAEGIVRKNLNAVRGQVRGAADDKLSLALVAGGGASSFRDALGRAFDGTLVVAVPDTVHANARGFFVWAGRD